MKVYLKVLVANSDGVFRPDPHGKPVEVPDKHARNLISQGLATPLDSEPVQPHTPEPAQGETVIETAAAAVCSAQETAIVARKITQTNAPRPKAPKVD